MDIQFLVNDLLAKLKEIGYSARVEYCFSQAGEVISFEIDILGRLE